MRTGWQRLLAVMLLVAVMGCGGDDDGDGGPTTPTEPTTAAQYTGRGWERFEAGDFADAQADFAAAIGLDDGYGPAHNGLGWARLVQAASAAAMQTATTSFDAAVAAGTSSADVLAGRAAAKLGTGGASLGGAVTDAESALAAANDFVFAHRTSFDARDLRLIVAFARAAQGNYSAALVAADAIEASGITAGNPATWTVDGVTYGSFNAAVLARLHQLSEEYAG